MRCIFCRCASDASRSVEHIIPESLGNSTAILRPGIVCDGCNNYFARKVEQPLLESRFFKDLRGRQQLENKRGRVPSQTVTVNHREEGELLRGELFLPSGRHPERRTFVTFGNDPTTVSDIMFTRGARILNSGAIRVEYPNLLSRFLAKISLEFLADRCSIHDGWESFVIDNPELDPLRNHARRGNPANWAYSHREIYDEQRSVNDKRGQTVWEWVPFVSHRDGDQHLVYSVLCLFGQEYAISYADPDIEDYKRWLAENNGKSPLYMNES